MGAQVAEDSCITLQFTSPRCLSDLLHERGVDEPGTAMGGFLVAAPRVHHRPYAVHHKPPQDVCHGPTSACLIPLVVSVR